MHPTQSDVRPEDVQDRYNTTVKDKYKGDYESARWFSNDLRKAGYDMTRNTIVKRVIDPTLAAGNAPKRCLELGPGAGTWTKLLVAHFPHSTFDLVDISREMLENAHKSLPQDAKVSYFEKNFLEYQADERYDFFFSSRVIEYFPDKKPVVGKILSLLASGGTGHIITKTPKYFFDKIVGRGIQSFHSGQIHPKTLAKLLRDNGCTDVVVRPVVFSFPRMSSPALNKMLYKIFGGLKLNPFTMYLTESYIVSFKKA